MNKQQTIVFKVSDNVKDKIIEYYDILRLDKTPPYAVFQAKEADSVITLYESGKVMFQGISADIDANMWKDMEMHLNNRNVDAEEKKKENEADDKTYYYFNAIGSDEVGTGDYFGPIVVTATYVDKESRKFLEELKVNDSKKLTDEKILRCAPMVMDRIPYATVLISNKEYNELIDKGNNANKIKAIFHNKVLVELERKGFDYHKIIVDQFAQPRNYFSYIYTIPKEEKVTKITFLTKAESKHLSVAAASVISRYIFLKEYDKLSDKYKINFVKGAGEMVDKIGKDLVSKYGKNVLNEIAKVSFKNTDKIIGDNK